MKLQNLVLKMACCISVLFYSINISYALRYTAVDLIEKMGWNYEQNKGYFPAAINDRNMVVFTGPDGKYHRATYDQSSGELKNSKSLSCLHIYDINNHGVATGEIGHNTDREAFIWNPDDSENPIKYLGIINNSGYRRSVGYHINDNGTVVGMSTYKAWIYSYSGAFIYENGSMELLPSIRGTKNYSAQSINNKGDAVGSMNSPEPILWTKNSDSPIYLKKVLSDGMTYLSNTFAKDINDNRKIIGIGTIGSTTYGCVWENYSSNPTLLNAFGTESTIVDALNNSGVIVGHAKNTKGKYTAFVSIPGEGTFDLNEISDIDSSLWLYNVFDINNLGWIVASARRYSNNTVHPILLIPDTPTSPVPEPPTALLLILGFLAFLSFKVINFAVSTELHTRE